MKIQCWSIGKSHESYVKEGIEDFTRRINKYFPASWSVIPLPKNAGALSESELKKREGEIILSLLQKEDYLVVLDERGQMLDSPGVADLIQKRANESVRNLVFMIGGAYGTDNAVLRRANYQWSL